MKKRDGLLIIAATVVIAVIALGALVYSYNVSNERDDLNDEVTALTAETDDLNDKVDRAETTAEACDDLPGAVVDYMDWVSEYMAWSDEIYSWAIDPFASYSFGNTLVDEGERLLSTQDGVLDNLDEAMESCGSEPPASVGGEA